MLAITYTVWRTKTPRIISGIAHGANIIDKTNPPNTSDIIKNIANPLELLPTLLVNWRGLVSTKSTDGLDIKSGRPLVNISGSLVLSSYIIIPAQ